MDIISKVARAYAPSIIFLDGGEKPWLKEVPPAERLLQPKRFAKYFVKLVKGIKPGDQVNNWTDLNRFSYCNVWRFLGIRNALRIVRTLEMALLNCGGLRSSSAYFVKFLLFPFEIFLQYEWIAAAALSGPQIHTYNHLALSFSFSYVIRTSRSLEVAHQWNTSYWCI